MSAECDSSECWRRSGSKQSLPHRAALAVVLARLLSHATEADLHITAMQAVAQPNEEAKAVTVTQVTVAVNRDCTGAPAKRNAVPSREARLQ